jgi:2-polyprenyl-3-methyl-5-hydroxy-6-metoxy-1,4-benzoquinol methylase
MMKITDFSHRASDPELMDNQHVEFDVFRGCLEDLAKVNWLTLAYGPTLGFLERLRRLGALPDGASLTLLDVGSGYGDTVRQIQRWAARRSISMTLTGIDLNPWSARAAGEATPSNLPINWVTTNVFDYQPQAPVDIIVSSLFTHHLEDHEVVRFISWMERTARLGWFVSDLHRHPVPFHAFRLASRMLRLHQFVQHDGPISIARSFRAADWRRHLAAAGVVDTEASIEWRFPFRLCVARVQPHG